MIRTWTALAALALALAGCGPSDRPGGGDPDAAVPGDSGGGPSVDAGDQVPDRVLALDPNRYGVVAHLAGDDMLTTFANGGLGWVRIDLDWDQIETARDDYHWENVDRVVDAADRLGLSVYGAMGYTPQWASGQVGNAHPPTDPADFVEFVRETVRRYRGRIDCMGIWNEPNLQQFWAGDKQQFIDDILVPGLIAIREEAPEMVTCGPDLSSSGNERANWLAPILDAAADHLDVITHHQYDGGDTVRGRALEIDALRRFLDDRGLGARPIWITEIGWSLNGVSEAEQASLLEGVMAAMVERPFWAKTFWYDSHGGDFGLLHPDDAPTRGTPRPAFEAYRAFISAH